MPYLRHAFMLILALSTACTSQKAAYQMSDTMIARPQQEDDRKILYNADLTLTVETPDSTSSYIQAIAKRYGGYVNETGTYRSIIRVESQLLDAAIDDISQLGRLDRKSIRGQDVTETYLDYQIRLDNAQQARGRYLDLLDQAATVDEILKVEKELERLNETIDLLKGKMNRIDHLDTYATITINLRERQKPGILGYIGIGLYRGVRWLFVRG
ncbi:DUF4349 domain-containing protein [Phaeodactylibacter sp.]|jgi:hypothetical protein|uniref:DUF4349 domain-containing protein n=1 Tax=Phaeodactylibacter sp. TaxID=1940289 RepID=UPI0025DF3D5A|nr:DUF4349 domain-containing protein [Phaeodactylibacter sp.]MCI4651119.1 DUF4349 domain-containing protein [Phaeodactylibacter sp.]MCI5093047.1 DUF4349 domain-containing protein [Phaeodactylibacter sp.]